MDAFAVVALVLLVGMQVLLMSRMRRADAVLMGLMTVLLVSVALWS